MNTTTQPVSALAGEIIDRHKDAQDAVHLACGNIDKAKLASVNCAILVETAKAKHGRGFKRWWGDEVGLPDSEAGKYLTIYKYKDRNIDKAQMHLIGFVEPLEHGERDHVRSKEPFAWTRYVSSARDALNSIDFKTLTNDQRQASRLTVVTLRDELTELIDRLEVEA